MKKFISAATLMIAFTLAALGQITLPDPNCTRGHINTPVYVCEPPQQRGATASANVKTDTDDSVLTIIENFIAEYNPFGYFLT